MTTVRRFTCDDLFTFNNVNLDVLTETYDMRFYLNYMSKWPELFTVMESPCGRTMAYSTSLFWRPFVSACVTPPLPSPPPPVIGKAEGEGKLWHGHVSAVTVAPEYRRLGLARRLMQDLERISDCIYKAYFVDLFVRESNKLAIGMYQALGYVVYRVVLKYYSTDEENAFDMRKSMTLDPDKESMVPLPHPIHPADLEW